MKTFLLVALALALSCATGGSVTEEVTKEDLDQDLVLEQLATCIQTYRSFANMSIQAPTGWVYNGKSFQGDDFFLGTLTEESFGLIFERDDQSGDLLFAFRGTDTVEEWWDDAQAKPVAFVPRVSSGLVDPIPEDLRVEEGFYKIYTTIREELFGIIEQKNPQKIYVTGHSLGSALATLFVFEVGLSYPEISVISYNFASPRVGNPVFVQSFRDLPDELATPTVRIRNLEDLVPDVPLEWEGYEHIPYQYSIDFKKKGALLPDFALRHSADNYFTTLEYLFGIRMEIDFFSSTRAELEIKE